MDALSLITNRSSPAALDAPGPCAADLDKILQAAVAAPDHGHMRPWRFVVVEGDALAKAGDLMAEALKRREPEAPQGKIDNEKKKAMRAPMIIFIVATVVSSPKVPDIEQIVAVGAASQNMLLAAHALGYGGLWRTGSNAYDAGFKKALGIAEADTVVGIMYLGTPKVLGKPRVNETAAVTRHWVG